MISDADGLMQPVAWWPCQRFFGQEDVEGGMRGGVILARKLQVLSTVAVGVLRVEVAMSKQGQDVELTSEGCVSGSVGGS